MRQRKSLIKKCILTAIPALFIFTLFGIRVEAGDEKTVKKVAETPEIVEEGKEIYEKNCINCHGEKGDAKAPATAHLYPEPRDFTMGLFKIKSTAEGDPPTEEDIFNTITRGMPGTSMPGWPEIPLKERWGLVYYVMSFSDRFKEAKEAGKYPPPTIKVGKPIPSSPESIKKGRGIFVELQCDACHGEGGRADGILGQELETDWETKIFPRDLTRRWTFRRGNTPRDIYRTVRIGVEGTPMPSFAETLDTPEDEDVAKEKVSGEERTWRLVNYVLSLSSAEKPEAMAAYKVQRIEEALPDNPDDERWKDVLSNEYPMGGQITIKPRMFTPRIDFVRLKALYNQDEIAFLLTWHDPSEMTKTDSDEGFFADAMALQLPQNPEGQKPYFLNGDSENPVYLLRWNSDSEGSIAEINATGMTRMVAQEDGKQNAKGSVVFDKGEYRLLIKRPLKTDDEDDIQFEPGKFVPVAFSAWEGSNGETGTKRSISAWYFLVLEAQTPKTVYYYPFVAIFLVAGFEIILIRWLRKKKKEAGS